MHMSTICDHSMCMYVSLFSSVLINRVHHNLVIEEHIVGVANKFVKSVIFIVDIPDMVVTVFVHWRICE